MILGPNPATASQSHTIGIECLKLNRDIRGELNIKRPIFLDIYLTKDTSLRHRRDTININSRALLISPDICIGSYGYPFEDTKSFYGTGGQPSRFLKVIDINIQAIKFAVRVFFGNHARPAIRLWSWLNCFGLDIMIIRSVKN
jgi:hypothetical protein